MDGLVDAIRPTATILVVAVALYAYLLAFVGRKVDVPTEPPKSPLLFVVLVPCLNERSVIGRTIVSLSAMTGRHHIVVVDDDSDDGSRDVIRGFPAWRVTLVERHGAESRVGKGAALNHGLREALSWGLTQLYSPEDIIVAVFDSDTLVRPDFLDRVTPYFADPRVVGVQSGVRMFNAGQNLLTYWQHLEFVLWARIFSRGKDRLGSATLGGNGQCVRLSALLALGPNPWRASLTEDLDLSLRLIRRGGRIRFCGQGQVYQEALPGLVPLFRQRARWLQGHLVNWGHIPGVLSSGIPVRARLDLVVLLLLPAALGPLAIATVDGWRTFFASLGTLSVAPLVVWYLLAFASAPLTTWALRREGVITKREAFFQAHRFLVYTIFWTISAVRAVWSILRGDRSWAKTTRSSGPYRSPARHGADGATPTARTSRSGARTRPRLVGAGGVAAVAILASSSLVVVAAAALAQTYENVTTRAAPATGEVLGATQSGPGFPPAQESSPDATRNDIPAASDDPESTGYLPAAGA